MLNLISYAMWCLVIIFYFIIDEPRKDHTTFTIHYLNLVVLLVSLCMSVAFTFCGLPFYFNKLYQRAKNDKMELSRKIGQIRLLPKVRFNNKIHNSISFCTICMVNFKNATSYITYLPCDARHYFHTKCVRSWLLSKEQTCPLCKVPVNFKKSIEYDQVTEYSTLVNNSNSDMLSI